jgi:hypothetical protein
MNKTNGKLNPADDTNIPFDEPIAYPASDDIYNKFRKVDENNPDDITTLKENGVTDAAETGIEENFKDELIGSNLDVPGSELDDQQENIGSEDEENNYYSLGGDNHIELEEN